VQRAEPGSASLVLAGNVVHLDPAPAVFEAMLRGWATQQRSRFLAEDTVTARLRMVRRLVEFSNLYPWQWAPAEGEAFIAHLRSGETPVRLSTARGYEVTIRLFCDYVLDARYGWLQECVQRFGAAPQQVFHEDNSVVHVTDFEGDPGRRPLTYDEVQALFDAADALLAKIRGRGVKGALPALRDAALLKVTYAFGVRRREVSMLDLVDVRTNTRMPQFGRYGQVMVRHGKASRGGAPKRRTVLLVPEMDWVVPVLEHWLTEVRPALLPGRHPALWVTERRGRVSTRVVNEAFCTARDAAGLDPLLDLHSLRHSYITHLIEFGYPVKFVQDQVGHKFASTTAIYTGVSNEFRNELLQQKLRGRLGQMWDEDQ
jgi:site-specific recombinase XerD